MRMPERSPPWTWPWWGEGGWAQQAAAPNGWPPRAAHTHHVHDARHPHHLQQPVVHSWLLELRVAIGTPQVSARPPAVPRGRGAQVSLQAAQDQGPAQGQG